MFSSVPIRSLSAALLVFAFSCSVGAQTRTGIPAPQTDASLANKPGKEVAIFAGGCSGEHNPFSSV